MLPAFSLKPIMVVGRSWIDTEFITISIIPEKVIFPLLSSKRLIALTPLGVDALPSPSIFDDIFIAIYFFASSFFVLNKKLIIGLRILANLSESPLLSNMLIMPSHTAYIPTKLMQSSTTLEDADSISDVICSGFEKIKTLDDKNIIKNQIIDILIIIQKLTNRWRKVAKMLQKLR